MTIYEKLAAVQQELHAPKDKKNDFGKYNYRSCEGILEALKPLLAKNKATVTLLDNLVSEDGRFYIQATASFHDLEGDGVMPIMSFGYAREAEKKSGMDEAQITGSASSYARKYALNGLFLIDDNKDADTNEYHELIERAKQEEKEKDKKKSSKDKPQAVLDNYITATQCVTLEMMLNKADIPIEKFNSIYGLTVMSELPADKYEDAVSKLEVAVEAKKKEGK